jgi:putative transposase
MAEHIHKRHNVTLLVYHIVVPAKYRRKVFTEAVSKTLKQTCVEFGMKYEVEFLEIGSDEDHVHFLVQTIPTRSVTDLIKLIKSLTARKVFELHPEVKDLLWGGHLWTSGYYVNTVGQFGNLKMLTNYVQKQGIKNYVQLHTQQPSLFD